MTTYQCKICANTQNNQVVIAKEMMLGFRDEFTYFKCSSCGCLQIVMPPEDLSKYYPSENYYSYQPAIAPTSKKEKWNNFLKCGLFNAYWHLKMPLQKFPYVRNFSWLNSLQKIAKTSAILDIGCGNGHLLQEMSMWGFKNLTGIDPFIENDISYTSGVKILKSTVFNHVGKYDLIMLHHSFEHMDNPYNVLNQLHQLLNPEGELLIRIPVSDSFAWRKYGVNWVQLDAPRHLFLYTTKSIARLAKCCNFILKQVRYDSTAAQFLQSEKYCKDITLHENIDVSSSYIRKCKKQAVYLNKMKDGDQACFVLKKCQENTEFSKD
jgi:2-polyprenyl-3-methyl-5-hydroxy-6-metoxy-1,4-benzoquinol methylase